MAIRLTETRLRQIIRQEARRLQEAYDYKTSDHYMNLPPEGQKDFDEYAEFEAPYYDAKRNLKAARIPGVRNPGVFGGSTSVPPEEAYELEEQLEESGLTIYRRVPTPSGMVKYWYHGTKAQIKNLANLRPEDNQVAFTLDNLKFAKPMNR